MDKLRMGVIGLGNFGMVHTRVLSQMPEVELLAVCDAASARAQAVAARFGAPYWCTDYRDLLQRQDIDAVDIVTTVIHHAEVTEAALESGKHVFVEKPLALDLEGHDRIIALADRRGLTVLVGYIRRYDTRFIMLKEALGRGELGNVVAMYSRRNCGRSMLDTPRYTGTKVPLVIEPGIHAMDLFVWLGGAPARRVYAVERHVLGLSIADVYLASVMLANGVVGTIEQVYHLPERAPVVMDAQLEVIGSSATVQIIDPDPGFSIWNETGTTYPNAMLRAEAYGQIHGALTNELGDFVRCVLRGHAPAGASALDSRAAVDMGLAIVRSAQTGLPVEL